MAHEIEAAQLEAAGGWFRRRRPPRREQAMGTPCANCATPLMGPWCHACGQLGEDFHRSWFKLAGESVEGVFHFDGRVWRTLPDLALRPARLTRRYLEGHRAPQVPPLRLFLVVLLVLFFVGAMTGGNLLDPGGDKGKAGPLQVQVADLTPAQKESLADAIAKARAGKLSTDQTEALARQLARARAHPFTDADRDKIKSRLDVRLKDAKGESPPAATWLRDRVTRVLDRPGEFQLVLEAWSERFAFLMLPISALLLGVLFVFQRRFYIFDHLVFSMHSLSFLGLLIALYLIAQKIVGDWADWLLFIPPVHLFAHMRGVYATGVAGTLVRMALLFAGSLVGFAVLMVGLIFVGLAGLGR